MYISGTGGRFMIHTHIYRRRPRLVSFFKHYDSFFFAFPMFIVANFRHARDIIDIHHTHMLYICMNNERYPISRVRRPQMTSVKSVRQSHIHTANSIAVIVLNFSTFLVF